VTMALPVFELAELKEDDCETVELPRAEKLRLLEELVAELAELVDVGLDGMIFAAAIA
jgi:hypothetical protein